MVVVESVNVEVPETKNREGRETSSIEEMRENVSAVQMNMKLGIQGEDTRYAG